MITAADVREVALTLPRTEEHLIRDYIKFRVGKIVYASISPDELRLGFGFPKEEREAMIASRPDVFLMPRLSDQRYQWINAHMSALGKDELRELITDAWRMCVPKKVAAAQDRQDQVMTGKVPVESRHPAGEDARLLGGRGLQQGLLSLRCRPDGGAEDGAPCLR